MNIIIHTDGGARGNPGPAGIGVVIEEVRGMEHRPLASFGKTIGRATNNVAEYMAVVEALRWLKDKRGVLQASASLSVQFFLDSTLVVHQLNGAFKTKDARLRLLLTSIRVLEQEVGGQIHYGAVPREQNYRADLLVNKALDEQGFSS